MTTKEKIIYTFSILFASVVLNFFVIKLYNSKTNQREQIKELLKATDSIFTSLDYLSRENLDSSQKSQIKEEIEKARAALRTSTLLEMRLESY